jgi:hypothetical protein
MTVLQKFYLIFVPEKRLVGILVLLHPNPVFLSIES